MYRLLAMADRRQGEAVLNGALDDVSLEVRLAHLAVVSIYFLPGAR